MWCRACQQDVPGLISAHTGDYSCSRCGAGLREGKTCSEADTWPDQAGPQTATGPGDPPLAGAVPDPPPAYDGWELEQRLRHIERVLEIDQPEHPHCGTPYPPHLVRLDPAHAAIGGWHYPAAARAKAAKRRNASTSPAESWLPVLTWTVLSMGLMASVCGGVLLAWAAASSRQDLWAVGMPIGLGGQIVLVIGLILQLDRLWHDNRSTAEKLDDVDEQLHDLSTTATLLGTSHGPASRSFYSHMAGGASPQLLLADLKSQLDLLAVRLAQQEQ